MKKQFTSILFIVLVLICHNLKSEGTKQVMPNAANGTALYVSPLTNNGSFKNAPTGNRIYFRIKDNATENLFFGLNAKARVGTSVPTPTNCYYVIKDPNNNVVLGPTLFSPSGAGFINTYSEAVNGPNIGGATPTGYNPLMFDPNMDGDYYIELYRSNDFGATQVSTNLGELYCIYFDFTVAKTDNTKYSGRVHCQAWSFITYNPVGPNFTPQINNSFEGDYFALTQDSSVVRVNFEPNFRPFGFILSLNYNGVGNTGNFINDRKSIFQGGTAPTYTANYRSFLQFPDTTIFKTSKLAAAPALNSQIYGCPGAYIIPYYVNKAGDVAIILDLNGISGYQNGTEDVVLEAYGVSAGNNVISWNGLNGLGATVSGGTSIGIKITVFRGRTNLPMYDAELNTNGFSVTAFTPTTVGRPIYWDDATVANFGTCGAATDNVTGVGVSITNLISSGIIGPTHGWDGPGASTLVPAPSGGGGSSTFTVLCDDFGNSRILNSWFYGSEVSSPSSNRNLPTCDNDGDGVSNSSDLDDDNDGILDSQEIGALTDPLADADSDGVPNYLDPQFSGFVDSNFDGVDDRYDTDKDGIINSFDLDSDNDGCSDANEAYNNISAQGSDGNMYYGNGNPPTVGASGTVTAASYSTPNANYTNSLITTACIVPQPINDALTTPQNTLIISNAGTNDSGTNGGNFTIGSIASGTIIMNSSTGQFTYTPNSTFVGVSSVTYTLCNGAPVTCSTAIISITVTGVTPVAVTDGLSTPQNTVATGSLGTNDTGANAINSPTYTVTQPSSTTGTITLNPSTGQYTFAPNPTFVGTGSTTYTLCNNTGSCSSTTITYTVTGTSPVAVTDAISTPQNTVATGSLGTNDTGANAINSPTFTVPQLASTTGTITLNPSTGQYTFTPNPTFVGTGSTTYTLCNNTGSCSSTTITYIVTGTAPVAVTDGLSTPQNTVATGSLVTNDTGANAINSPTFTVTQPVATTGTITLNPSTGQYTFTPNTTFVGTGSTTYTLCNNTGSCSSTTITYTVTGTNPVAVSDVISTPQGTTTTGSFAGNDTGANAINSPTFTVTQPAASTGTITLNSSTGQYTFAPNPSFVGSSTITYTLCNNTGLCSSTSITLTTAGVTPVAVTDGLSTPQNTVATGSLGTNDTGANAINSPTFTVTQLASTTGTITLNPSTGQYTFTPNTTFVGTGSTTYTLCNNTGSCSSTTITYTVTGTTPVAVTDAISTPQNTVATGSLGTNDTGANAINSPMFTVTQLASTTGTITLNSSTGQYTFTPNPTFVGTGSTTYTLCNNTGSCSSTTITYTVTGTAPVAVTDGFSTPQGTVTAGTLAGNDTGANAINSPTFVVTQPSSTTGTITLNPSTGQYTFTPNPTFVGTGSTTYTLCNNTGSCSSTTITYTVTGTAPIAVTDPISTPQGTTTTGTLAGNDTGANAINSPTYTVTQPSSTTGTITLNPSTGQYTFTPNPTFVGTGSTTYTLCNNTGSCSSTTITYSVYPDVLAIADVIATTPSLVIDGNLLTNDSGIIPDYTYSVSLTPITNATGTISLNSSTGDYTFTPNPAFTGSVVIVYNICNISIAPQMCSTNSVVIQVYPVPVAVNDNNATMENTPVTGNASTNDVGTNLALYTVDASTSGTLTINSATGNYTFTPASGFTGVSNTTYTLCNGAMTSCTTAVITITVYPTLLTLNDLIPTTPSVSTTGYLLNNDNGIVSNANYSVTVSPVAGSTGTLTINASTGDYTFTPNPAFTGTASTTYTVCNVSVMPIVCSTATITLQVSNLPVAVADENTTIENTLVIGNIGMNDSGVIPSLNPIYTVGSVTAGTGTLTTNASGNYTYTPATGFTGTTVATYTLCNLSSPPCSSTTITFTVYPLIQTTNDAIVTTPSTSVTGNILANESGVVTNADYSVTVTQPASNTGTISVDPATGNYTFTPNPTFVGTANTTYTVCNISVTPEQCATATISILVGSNPVADDDVINILQGQTNVTGSIATNDVGTEATLNSNFAITQPANTTGTITVDVATGNYTFTPNPIFTGTSTTTYTLCNITSTICSTANITIVVTPTIVANADVISTTPSVTTTGNLTSNDINASVNYTVFITSPSTGTLTINSATGDYTYTPDPTISGTVVTTYTVCNNTGCSTNSITIIVGASPIAVNDNTTTTINTSVSGNLGTNDSGNSPSLNPTYTGGITPNGTFVVDASTGNYTFTPNSGYTGTTTVTYTLCNTSSAVCSIANLEVVVTNPTFTVNPDVLATSPTVTTIGNLTANDVALGTTYTVTVTDLPVGTGTIIIDPSTGNYTFTPDPSYTGVNNTSYTVCNNTGCVTTTITVITATNIVAPVAVTNSLSILQNTTYVSDLGSNDTAVGAVNSPTFIVTQPSASTGTITLNSSTGQYTFTPNPTYIGTGSTTYTVCNNTGNCSSTTITYTVYPSILANEDVVNTTPSVTVTGNLLTNDNGISPSFSYSVTITQPANTTGTIVIDPATGNYTFIPNPGFVGTTVASYTVCNTSVFPEICSDNRIVINVYPTPIAIDDINNTLENTSVTGNAGANDTGTTLGIFTAGSASSGTLAMNPATGDYTYTPVTGYTGTVVTTYTLCNGASTSCTTAVITITVYPMVSANPDVVVTTPTTTTTGNVLSNDNGVVANASYSVTITQIGSSTGTLVLDPATGNYTFTPNPSFTGTLSITYTVCNTSVNPEQCNTSTINIVVGNAALANNDNINLLQGETVATGTLATNDLGADNFLNPNFAVTQSNASTGTISVDPSTGNYTFTPNPVFTGTASITYTLCNVTSSVCSTATITIIVTPTVATNSDVISTTHTLTTTGNLTSNDIGTGTSYTVAVTNPSTGTLTVDPATGNYTYTPNPAYGGTVVTTYTLCNNTGCSSNTISIVVANNPLAVNDYTTTLQGSPVSGSLGTNDSGNAPSLNPTYTGGSSPNGTFVVNPVTGQYTFTPNSGYSGTTTVTYVLCNGTSTVCSTATLVIVVIPTIVAFPDVITVTNTITATGNLAGNDLNTGTSYTVSITQPSTGTLTINPVTGDYTFTPNPNYTGTVVTTYTICNSTGCSTASITIIVNSPPVIVPTPTLALAVPDIFSPNGDGINDVLIVQGIDLYPNAELQIFNRWGNIVYKLTGADEINKNPWSGKNTEGIYVGGDDLPVGTYFYILEPNKEGFKAKTGYIYLQR